MRESELEKKFCRLVRQAGGKAYKFTSPGHAGVPDRLVVLPGGRVGFIELKKKGEQLRKLQKYRMEELEALGCFTAVVSDEDAAVEVIQALQVRERIT